MFVQRMFVGLVILVSCSQGFAWGAKGHEIVASAGATNAQGSGAAFWHANVAGMRQLSTVPDRVWKTGGTFAQEDQNHWFQVDYYFQKYDASTIQTFPKEYAAAVQKYGASVVDKNGTAPWRIVELYGMAVAAFKSGQMAQGMQYAGTMSHYIGDLSQPLHVSENFDGASTNQKGIHAWFETTNIVDENAIMQKVIAESAQMLRAPNYVAQMTGPLDTIIYNEIARAIAWRDTVLANDKQYGRGSAQGQAVQLQLAIDRMSDGAAVLATVLKMMWDDVGRPINATPIPVQDPAWVQNTYTTSRSTPFVQPTSDEDDCGAR